MSKGPSEARKRVTGGVRLISYHIEEVKVGACLADQKMGSYGSKSLGKVPAP